MTTETQYPTTPYAETLAGGQEVTITRVSESGSYAVFDGCVEQRACTAVITASPITRAAIKAAIEAQQP